MFFFLLLGLPVVTDPPSPDVFLVFVVCFQHLILYVFLPFVASLVRVCSSGICVQKMRVNKKSDDRNNVTIYTCNSSVCVCEFYLRHVFHFTNEMKFYVLPLLRISQFLLSLEFK